MDLSAHISLALLAEAVAAVLRPASAAGIEVYIAGALARDLWLEFAYGIDTGRRTADVDFAVECSDWAAFESLRAALLRMADWCRATARATSSTTATGPSSTCCRTAGSSAPIARWPGRPASISG